MINRVWTIERITLGYVKNLPCFRSWSLFTFRRLTVVSDGRDDSTKWLDRTSFFVSAVLLSTFILLFLLSSSVLLSYFYLAVPMLGCLGKHSWMSSPFPIAYWMELPLFRHQYSFVVTCLLLETKLNKHSLSSFLFYLFIATYQPGYL